MGDIKIHGKKYKVDKVISNTIESLAEALHSHEIALLTWAHKCYMKRKTKTKDGFEKALHAYVMKVPEAENILKRMEEYDRESKK